VKESSYALLLIALTLSALHVYQPLLSDFLGDLNTYVVPSLFSTISALLLSLLIGRFTDLLGPASLVASWLITFAVLRMEMDLSQVLLVAGVLLLLIDLGGGVSYHSWMRRICFEEASRSQKLRIIPGIVLKTRLLARASLRLGALFERRLRRAGLRIHPIFFGAFLLLMIFLSLAMLFTSILLGGNLSSMVASLVPALLTPICILISVELIASRKRRRSEFEAPFFALLTSMYTIGSVKGVEALLQVLSKDLRGIFPELSKEGLTLELYRALSPAEAHKAIEMLASSSPCASWRELLEGYILAEEKGGNVRSYTERASKELLDFAAGIWEKYSKMGLSLVEALFLLLSLVPMGISLIALTLPGQHAANLISATFIGQLLLSASLMLLVDGFQPLTYNDLSFGRELAAWVLASIALGGFASFYTHHFLLVGLFFLLILASIGSYRIFSSIEKEEKICLVFLRELLELQRSGLSIGEAIRRTTREKYGPFFWGFIEKFRTAVEMGVQPHRIGELLNTRSWFVKSMFSFLGFAIESGLSLEATEKILIFYQRYYNSKKSLRASSYSALALGVAMPFVSASGLSFIYVLTSDSLELLKEAGWIAELSAGGISEVLSGALSLTLFSGLILGLFISKVFSNSFRDFRYALLTFTSSIISLLLFGLI